MKILHISNDEKFLDSAVMLFESVTPGQNIYLVNGRKKEDLKFVKSRIASLVAFPYRSKEYFNFIEQSGADLIFIHGLSVDHKYVLTQIGEKYKVYWYSWGKDMYWSDKLRHHMYKPDTEKLLKILASKDRPPLKAFIISIISILKGTKKPRSSEQYLKYIDFVGTVVQEDYELFSKTYPELFKHIEYIPFNYGGFVPNTAPVNETICGKDIQIGNSANPEGSHLESFALLDKISLGDAKIYVPLSYGGPPSYKNEIIRKGNSLFGGQFIPVTDFMPLREYNKLQDNIGVSIMNHCHQHAMGNIIKLLHSGVKVYMDMKNSAAKSLKRMGAIIFDVNEINNETFFIPLTAEQKTQNRQVMEDNYSDAVSLVRTKELVNYLEKQITSQNA